ncbi:hypothetical protein [Rhodococcoides kyotonense]|uniref:hypothetical protein n=1 Tax=Rhodococcoides kyotonense TaxID=398843 RepID=UPI000AC9F32A|nr:hypothetical protein [Rhodococcus kyotonensis]
MDSLHPDQERRPERPGHLSSGSHVGASMSTEAIKAHLARMFDDPSDDAKYRKP